jgi:hypothetical protein
MSLKAFAIDTAKVAPLALANVFWAHAPEIVQACMLVYSIGLAVQTCYRLLSWLRRKFAKAPA